MKTSDSEARRIAAIRRHRGKPAVLHQLKARIRAMVLADQSAKPIGLAVDLSAGRACDWIHKLGFRRMYVTAEERAWLMARRSETQAAEKKAA